MWLYVWKSRDVSLLQTFCEWLYIHVHVRKAIERIGFLLSPLRALDAVSKRTGTHQKTQFALGDFHSLFFPWFESMKDDRKLEFWLDVSIRGRIRNSKVTIKLYSFVCSKGNRWRHENLWRGVRAGGIGILSDFETGEIEGGGGLKQGEEAGDVLTSES